MQRTKLAQAAATLAIGAALMTAASASFAQSAVLKITGTISPAACTPTLTGGDTIDFGEVVPNGEYTRDTALQITCSSPTFVAFRVTDNRADSTPDGDLFTNTAGAAWAWLFPAISGPGKGFINGHNQQIFGLGKTTDGSKIGGYSLRLGAAKVSGTDSFLGKENWFTDTGVSLGDQVDIVGGALDGLYKWIAGNVPVLSDILNAKRGLWITRNGGLDQLGGWTGLYVAKGFKYTGVDAFTVTNALNLIPYAGFGVTKAANGTNFNFPIQVRAKINSSAYVSGAEAQKLDGQATFDLVYL